MARNETNYKVGINPDKIYRVGTGASQYGGRQRTLYQEGGYNRGTNYEQKSFSECYPMGSSLSAQENYIEIRRDRIKPYEDAFSLTFCSRCRAIRQKNSLCIRCGGL